MPGVADLKSMFDRGHSDGAKPAKDDKPKANHSEEPSGPSYFEMWKTFTKVEGMFKQAKNPFEKPKASRWEAKPENEEQKKAQEQPGLFQQWFGGQKKEEPENHRDNNNKQQHQQQQQQQRARQRPHQRQQAPTLPVEPEPMPNAVLNGANRGVYKTTRTCGQRVERTCGPSGTMGKAIEEFQHDVLESDTPVKNTGKAAFKFANYGAEVTSTSCGHGAERVCGRGTFMGGKLELFQHTYIEKDMHLYEKVHKRPGKGRRAANRYKDESDTDDAHQVTSEDEREIRHRNAYRPGPASDSLIDKIFKPYEDPYAGQYSLLGEDPAKTRTSQQQQYYHTDSSAAPQLHGRTIERV